MAQCDVIISVMLCSCPQPSILRLLLTYVLVSISYMLCLAYGNTVCHLFQSSVSRFKMYFP